jgi:hypothetical protein
MTVWYSDNEGRNYSFAGGALPFKGIGECQAVELTNGSVMVNARNEKTGCPNFQGCKQHHRLYAISNDGGTTFTGIIVESRPTPLMSLRMCTNTASSAAPQFAVDLPEPICSAGLINHRGTLYFSNPDSVSERTHMTLKKSTDSGNRWQVDTLVYGGPGAYSVVVPLDAERVGVVYERTYPEGPTTEDPRKITLAIVLVQEQSPHKSDDYSTGVSRGATAPATAVVNNIWTPPQPPSVEATSCNSARGVSLIVTVPPTVAGT